MSANPNGFDYFRRGEPLIALRGRSDPGGFDFLRRGEPPGAYSGVTLTTVPGATAVAFAFAVPGAATRIQAGNFPSMITYRVQVGWEIASGSIAVVGSAIVDTSVVGETPFDYEFGPDDDVTDSVVATVEIDRGRNDPTSFFQAATATVKLRDPTGELNPKNAASPLAGLLRPLRPARITAVYDAAEYPRFSGFIRTLTWEPQKRGGIATIDFVDLHVWLQRAKPIIASTGPTTTGAAIGLILDSIGWTHATLRDLDVGDEIPDFYADGTKTALELIEALLESERGLFYVDPGGVATYKDRHARPRQAVSVATISDVMTKLVPGVSVDNVKNKATVSKQGGPEQTATDPDSIFFYGESEWPGVESPYLQNDDHAAALAAYLVALGKDPQSPMWGLTVENRDDDAVAAMLALDLDDRVTVEEGQGGTSADFYVEGYRETIDKERNNHQLVLQLTETSTVSEAVVGVSTVDGADVVAF